MEPTPELTSENSVSALMRLAAGEEPAVALVDVTQGCDLEEVAAVAARWPDLRLIALGLLERRDDVVRHGYAGFVAYLARNASVADLQTSIVETMAGRLHCPAEISNGLIRALFRRHTSSPPPAPDPSLTGREGDVLHFIGRGFSNKEIARELGLSVGTVKQHVHNLFSKLGVSQRAHAMRRVREDPWISPRS
jgi:DNA-binding NarL/FixJ family response regulator